jgi:hypothetical protein
MSKKVWMIIGIIFTVLIVLAIIVFAINGANSRSFEGFTEEEKYLQFQAEIACEISEMAEGIDEDDPEEGMAVFGKMILLMQKKAQEYGYSEEDLQNLGMKYENNPEIEEKGRKLIGEMCPEALENMESP